jgi:tRNA threonylcarbamoyl adenosine modification protein YeaZ
VSHDGKARSAILAIDTATSRVVIGLGFGDGAPDRGIAWPAGHRHGEQLLPAIQELLAETGLDRTALDGIVVGTGPGAFTGLRVRIATAKALAHGLGRPLAGVATSDALIAAASNDARVPAESVVLLLPAGPSDRVLVRAGRPPRRLPAGDEPDLAGDELPVAVDLEGRASPDAIARGEHARARLGAELLRLGADRLRAGGDDPAGLVPEYVTLPRGVAAASGEVSWSRDPR